MINQNTTIMLLSCLILYCSFVSAQEKNYKNANDHIAFQSSFYASDSSEHTINTQSDTINECDHENSENYYIPLFQGGKYQNSLFSEPFKILNEPKLCHYEQESYRFTWIGYLGTSHNPLSIRIEKRDTTVSMIVKFIESRHRKNETNYNLTSDTLNVNESVWMELEHRLSILDFWKIPSIQVTDIVTLDGSEWIFEGKKENVYHAVYRTGGGESKEFRKLCMYLLDNSGLRIKKKEIY